MKDKYEEILERHGATNIKDYMLVNNYGYTFDLKGMHYDIRYWANCYGCAINRWEISLGGEKLNEEAIEIEKEFNMA